MPNGTNQSTSLKPPRPKPPYEPDPTQTLLEGTSPGEAAPAAGSAGPTTTTTPQPTGGTAIDQTIQTANQTAATSGRQGVQGVAGVRPPPGETPGPEPTCPPGRVWDPDTGQCVQEGTEGGGGGEGEPGEGGGTEPAPGSEDDISLIKQWWADRGMPFGPNDPDPWYTFEDFKKYMSLWESNGSVSNLSEQELAAHSHATIDGRIPKEQWMSYMPFRDDNCPAKRPYGPDCDHWKKAGMPHMDGPCPVGSCLEKPTDWSGGGVGGGGGGGGEGGGGTPVAPGATPNPAYNPEATYTTYDAAQLEQLAQAAGAGAPPPTPTEQERQRRQVAAAIPGGSQTTGSIWPSVMNL